MEHSAPPQYGIRQLLIFTTMVAVLFGAGRAALTLLAPTLNQGGYHESAAFGFLAVAAVLLSLPLVPSILLPRHSALAVAGILQLTSLATWWELPLYNQILGGGGGPQFMHFVWINCFTAAWILLLAGWVRWSGYCFCRRAPGGTLAEVN